MLQDADNGVGIVVHARQRRHDPGQLMAPAVIAAIARARLPGRNFLPACFGELAICGEALFAESGPVVFQREEAETVGQLQIEKIPGQFGRWHPGARCSLTMRIDDLAENAAQSAVGIVAVFEQLQSALYGVR